MDAAAASQQRLTADGSTVLGLILNDWDPATSAHSYHVDYDRAYEESP
jgi:hypothetical protein